jgi:hypothetical protein
MTSATLAATANSSFMKSPFGGFLHIEAENCNDGGGKRLPAVTKR